MKENGRYLGGKKRSKWYPTVAMTDCCHRWLTLWRDRFSGGSGHAIATRIGIWRDRYRISTLTLFQSFLSYLIFLYFLDYVESKRHVFAWQHIVTSTIHVQMWDHGDQRSSHVIDGGEEEMTSWVWMQSECSRAFIPTLWDWIIEFPWRKSRTCLRPCSRRWWVYHAHGCVYFDG